MLGLGVHQFYLLDWAFYCRNLVVRTEGLNLSLCLHIGLGRSRDLLVFQT